MRSFFKMIAPFLAPITAILGLAQSVKEDKSVKRAAQAQEEAARKTASAAEADMSRRNARKPDSAAIADRNRIGEGASGGTLLTGPSGVANSSLRVLQKSLLGQ